MLVLSRKENERIRLGDSIVVTVVRRVWRQSPAGNRSTGGHGRPARQWQALDRGRRSSAAGKRVRAGASALLPFNGAADFSAAGSE